MADSKSYDVSLDVEKVKGANISRYSDGYNYAGISCKMADNEFMSISYEWKGKDIPEFAMNVMEIMKALGKEKASIEDPESIDRIANYLKDIAAKAKKDEEMCEECNKPKEKCKCGDKDKKK